MNDYEDEIHKRVNRKIEHLKKLHLYSEYMEEPLYRQELRAEVLRDILLEQGELRNG